jgi:CheY-like chemotaxis protein
MRMKKRLMILNDARREIAGFNKLRERYSIIFVEGISDALAALKRTQIDAILLREEMPGMDAIEFLLNLRDLHPATPAIVICAENSHFRNGFPELHAVRQVTGPLDQKMLDHLLMISGRSHPPFCPG